MKTHFYFIHVERFHVFDDKFRRDSFHLKIPICSKIELLYLMNIPQSFFPRSDFSTDCGCLFVGVIQLKILFFFQINKKIIKYLV